MREGSPTPTCPFSHFMFYVSCVTCGGGGSVINRATQTSFVLLKTLLFFGFQRKTKILSFFVIFILFLPLSAFFEKFWFDGADNPPPPPSPTTPPPPTPTPVFSAIILARSEIEWYQVCRIWVIHCCMC